VKSLEGAELAEAMLKYRSKEKNNKFYLQVKTIFEEFYLLLFEMLHPWNTNIVEGLNKFFTKFLHKDRTYAMTIENKVQIYLAVAIDSIGYSESYERIAEKTGLTFCAVQKELDLHLDETKSYRRSYRKKPAVKIKRWQSYHISASPFSNINVFLDIFVDFLSALTRRYLNSWYIVSLGDVDAWSLLMNLIGWGSLAICDLISVVQLAVSWSHLLAVKFRKGSINTVSCATCWYEPRQIKPKIGQ
jgi:hypothetical protein